MKREFVESQPKYALSTAIPVAGAGRMRSPYPRENGKWYFVDEASEKLLVPYETFVSTSLPYIDGAELVFIHNWNNFNPQIDYYQVQGWALCVQDQSGWTVGDRILLNNVGTALAVDNTSITIKIRKQGIISIEKTAKTGEFNLISSRWQIYVAGLRQI